MQSSDARPSEYQNSLTAIRKEWRFLLFGTLMTLWSAPGQTFFIALFSGPIRENLALSYGDFGALYSAATLLSALVILWTGPLVDRVAIPRMAIAVVLGLASAAFLLSLSQSIGILFVALFLLRQLGQGLMMLTASTTMLRYLPSLAGRASAISSMGYVIGEATLPILVVTLIGLYGWNASIQLTAIAMLAIMLPAIIILLKDYPLRDRQVREQSLAENTPNKALTSELANDLQQPKHWTRTRVLRDPIFYLILPAILCQSILFTGFIFHQNFIIETKGWSLSWWAGLFSLYAGIAIVSKLLAGIQIDRKGALTLLPYSALPMAASLAILASSDQSYAAVLFFVGLGITTGVHTTLTGPTLLQLYGSKHLGAIKSLSSSFVVLGTATTPFLMGMLIDNGVSLATMCWSSVIYIILSTVLVVIARRIRDRSLNSTGRVESRHS